MLLSDLVKQSRKPYYPENVLRLGKDEIEIPHPGYKGYCECCGAEENTSPSWYGDETCNNCKRVFHRRFKYDKYKIRYAGFGTSYKWNCSTNLYEIAGNWDFTLWRKVKERIKGKKELKYGD